MKYKDVEVNALVDTEYFNGKEWKHLGEYTSGEKVLQYNLDGSAELVFPMEFDWHKPLCKEPFFMHNSCYSNLRSCHTGFHTIVLREGDIIKCVSQSDVLAGRKGIPTFCMYDGPLAVLEKDIAHHIIRVETGGWDMVYPKSFYEMNLAGKQFFIQYLTSGDFPAVECEKPNVRYRYNERFHSEEVYDLVDFIFSTTGYAVGRDYREDQRVYTLGELQDYVADGFTEVEGWYHNCCIKVPSHMLVLRYKGCIYVTGDSIVE